MRALLPAFLFVVAAIPSQQLPNETRGIYEAVARAVLKDGVPAAFIVIDDWRPVPPATAWVWERLPGVPAELRKKVAELPKPPVGETGEHYKVEDLPQGARLVTVDEIRPVVSRWPPGTNPIEEKYGTKWQLSFSKPVMTDDGLDAVVYWGYGCGPLCGAGGYAWLHRTARGSAWAVQTVTTIVS